VKLDDPAVVSPEYASEGRFRARRVVFRYDVEGPKGEEPALAAVCQVSPARVVELGSGLGEFAERVQGELGADVIALDVSPRMVDLARARGVAFVAEKAV
jgi:methylase of polypeptide subunit release factors